jgi:KDO2-lipid IV(A) lauroyltransferase
LAQKKNWFEVRAEYFVAAALVAGLRWLPRSAAQSLGFAAAGLLDRAVPRLRRIARRNLRLAFPELDAHDREAIVDGTFRTIGRLLFAVARFPSLSRANINQCISYEGLENYEAAKQAGRGVLVATGHLGNWELSAFSHALMTEPMNVMVRPLDNPLIDTLLESGRSRTTKPSAY